VLVRCRHVRQSAGLCAWVAASVAASSGSCDALGARPRRDPERLRAGCLTVLGRILVARVKPGLEAATVAEKLPHELEAQHAAVDCVGIARMRNLAARHCDRVNDDLPWQALSVSIGNLIQELGP
jgi:hypothetical protein